MYVYMYVRIVPLRSEIHVHAQYTQCRELQRLCVQSTDSLMFFTEVMAQNDQVLVTLPLEL